MRDLDVRGIRTRTGLSQSEFPERYQINLRTLQQWEQGGRMPDATVRAYPKAIAQEPAAVQRENQQASRSDRNHSGLRPRPGSTFMSRTRGVSHAVPGMPPRLPPARARVAQRD